MLIYLFLLKNKGNYFFDIRVTPLTCPFDTPLIRQYHKHKKARTKWCTSFLNYSVTGMINPNVGYPVFAVRCLWFLWCGG